MPQFVIDNDDDNIVDNDGDNVVILLELGAGAGNPLRAMERTMAASVVLMLAKFQGEKLPFTHLDDDPILLYVLPYDSRDVYGNYQTMKADAAAGKFDIPIQPGFDGSRGSLVNGDSIEYDGQVFQIQEVHSDALNAVFTAQATARTARVR